MKTATTDRCYTNTGRTTVEGLLKQAGLVETAGGTRFSYFGVALQGKTGYMVRVGARTFRLVHRVRASTGLIDVMVTKEHYHGKVKPEKVLSWAQTLVVRIPDMDAAATTAPKAASPVQA